MPDNNYKFMCECGKTFNNPQSFNGHKSRCRLHWAAKYGDDGENKFNELNKILTRAATDISAKNNVLKSKQKLQAKESEWLESGPHYCEKCGKELPKDLKDVFGSGKFCSRQCANSRVQTEEMNKSRSDKLKKPKKIIFCKDCGVEIDTGNYCISCRDKRYHARNVNAGRASAKVQNENRRSKNEIYFCELCENYFDNVKHNEPVFNGWDADVIITDYKLAILWNGKWHYEKVTKNHSVLQVQNRDKIKIDEIYKCGYTPYVIKDMGKYNKDKVEYEFNNLIDYISKNY